MASKNMWQNSAKSASAASNVLSEAAKSAVAIALT